MGFVCSKQSAFPWLFLEVPAGIFLSATKNGKTRTFEWMDQARLRKIPSNRGDSPDSLERTLSGRSVYYGIG
jgi:hypothetical protein